LYGYRVYGAYNPQLGQRYNPHKLLIDPYAQALHGALHWSDALYGYRFDSNRKDLSFDRRDSAFAMPKCRVVDSAFAWGDDRSPQTPWQDTVIYELHVKGFSQQNTQVQPQCRGHYGGLSCPASVKYLQNLGVTAVELLPVAECADERAVAERGLVNYWGYNPLALFAPSARYAAVDPVLELKQMVRGLHAAGIEVILDVVYNHTIEGNELGPTLSWRGLDNQGYYRLHPENRRHTVDYTGCGNTLNLAQPRVLQMVMDNLRYWVREFHVDGFRFDLAASLGRLERGDFHPLAAFFQAVQQDPLLSTIKLIAEPWDLGPNSYQLGQFPPGWREWNGRFRDSVRDCWRGESGLLGELASRLTGSSDLFQGNGRDITASVNFVTSHDGFTLADLVSYNQKHNEVNGEDNRDGDNHNRSWNCGVEGASDAPGVLGLRARQQRNFLATLLLSQGVPMLLAGDERGRSQGGNNNAYCQDNSQSWLDWDWGEEPQALFRFTRELLRLRKQHPLLRKRRFFQGRVHAANGMKDVLWLNPEGHEMTLGEWRQTYAKTLGVYLNAAATDVDAQGVPQPDQDLLLLLNAYHDGVYFQLPADLPVTQWQVVLDTHQPEAAHTTLVATGQRYLLQGRSLVLLTPLVT
jgi:glycogen operon protein